MKEIRSLALGLFFFFCCYLIGSFCSADFNILNWEQVARTSVGFIGGIVSIFIVVLHYFEVELKRK